MDTVLKIDDSDVISFESITNLINPYVYQVKNEHCEEKLIIDITNCTFLPPSHVVILACIIEMYHIRRVKITLRHSNNRLSSFLQSIRFHDYWQVGFDRNKFTQLNLCSSLCLWQVNNNMIDQYKFKIAEYFEINFIHGKDLQPFQQTIMELFNNINDHSSSPVRGYTFCQYYALEKKLVLAVCDFGLGIPTTLNNSRIERGEQALAECEALEQAMKKGVTSQSIPNNRGYGLDTIANVCLNSSGSLFIFSNFAKLTLNSDSGVKTELSTTNFPGTLVVVTLNTSALPQKEFEIEEEFTF